MSRQEELAGVRQGDILAGKYRVDEVLGVGGMGVVVAAHHVHLDDRVAIKLLLPETLGNQEAVSRFAREARAAVKIKSEHVARVTDVGTLENSAPYMVMEFLEGEDLAAWLSERGPLPADQAIEFVLQACEAIAEAHAMGIIHRDLKPANLFVARRPGGLKTIKVLDFGISKLTGLSASGGQSSATKTSALMGSPLYMSPEQMQSSKNVDSRGDIWALGVILYELITGLSPFTADTMPELILQIMSAEPASLRSRRPDVPAGLELVVMRCLEKDREKRYQTIAELAAALLPYAPKRARVSVDRISSVMHAAGLAESSRALMPPSEAPPPAQNATVAAFGRTNDATGRSKSAVIASVAGAAVVVVGVGLWFLLSGPSEAPPTATNLQEAPATLDKGSPTPERTAQAPPPVSPRAASASGATKPAVDPAAGQLPTPAASSVSSSPEVVAHPAPPSPVRNSKPLSAAKKRSVAKTTPRATPKPAGASATPQKPSLSSLIDDRR